MDSKRDTINDTIYVKRTDTVDPPYGNMGRFGEFCGFGEFS